MSREYLIRLISSKDHQLNSNELIRIIQKIGTDRYDKDRLPQFNDFYEKHSVDFFAEQVRDEQLEEKLKSMLKEFPKNTLGDRNTEVFPDIAIIYDKSKCEMIPNVYEGAEGSDCYKFKTKPIDALVEVRELK